MASITEHGAHEHESASFPDDPENLPDGCVVDGALQRTPVEDVADFVVIGSGASGATAALHLADRGFSVVLVEDGPWVRTREFGTELFPAMKKMFRGMGTQVMTGRAFVPILQGRCVGGSTTINSAIAWRAPDDVIADWSTRFGLGTAVTPEVLAPQFDAVERDLTIRAVSDEALGLNNALFGEAAKNLGFESHRIKRYDSGCRGSAGCLTGCQSGKKLGMNITYIPRALHRGARIYTNAHVEQVDTRDGRAVGITATMSGLGGHPVALRVRARRGVFVAASTIQTPNILRRSGVRAKALGKHFQAHPGISMAGVFDKPINMEFGAAQGFNSLAFLKSHRIKLESISLPPEIAAARVPGFGPELMSRLADYGHLVLWAVVIRAETEGEVSSLFGQERVKYAMNARDVERGRAGLKILTEMMFSVGAREVWPGVHGMPTALTSADQLELWDSASTDPRAYNMMASHLFGAARMGTDPKTSVVGTDFQTHAVRGLYVVDSSVFPTNLGVNPQHTIMAMARLGASRVADAPLAAV